MHDFLCKIFVLKIRSCQIVDKAHVYVNTVVVKFNNLHLQLYMAACTLLPKMVDFIPGLTLPTSSGSLKRTSSFFLPPR